MCVAKRGRGSGRGQITSKWIHGPAQDSVERLVMSQRIAHLWRVPVDPRSWNF